MMLSPLSAKDRINDENLNPLSTRMDVYTTLFMAIIAWLKIFGRLMPEIPRILEQFSRGRIYESRKNVKGHFISDLFY